MKNKYLLIFLLIIAAKINVYGQDQDNEYSTVPITKVFYKFGENLWDSYTYNFGLNLILATAGTYGMVETGMDWKYYEAVYGNRPLANYGMTANVVGYIMPAAFPVAVYSIGRFINADEKLQTLGVALAQTTILASGVNLIKGITGRRPPGIYSMDPQKTDYSRDFSLGFFKRGIIDGWPSGHTANAIASAVVISEIYDDVLWIRVSAFLYAGAVSIGTTFCDHWASDVVAGWILGYGIGKTVGRSFKKMKNTEEQKISLDVSANYVGIKIVM